MDITFRRATHNLGIFVLLHMYRGRTFSIPQQMDWIPFSCSSCIRSTPSFAKPHTKSSVKWHLLSLRNYSVLPHGGTELHEIRLYQCASKLWWEPMQSKTKHLYRSLETRRRVSINHGRRVGSVHTMQEVLGKPGRTHISGPNRKILPSSLRVPQRSLSKMNQSKYSSLGIASRPGTGGPPYSYA